MKAVLAWDLFPEWLFEFSCQRDLVSIAGRVYLRTPQQMLDETQGGAASLAMWRLFSSSVLAEIRKHVAMWIRNISWHLDWSMGRKLPRADQLPLCSWGVSNLCCHPWLLNW